MKMTLYYVGMKNDYHDMVDYIAGPFRAYWQACEAKDDSNIVDEHLLVVEQTVEVEQ